MTTFTTLVDRAKLLLRDTSADEDTPTPKWARASYRRQLDNALARLARAGLFGNVLVIQAEAQRSLYPLNEQALWLASGRDNGGGTGSATQLTDSTADFVTAGVVAGDRLRNLTDGAQGTLTTVAATVLTCSAGFTGGVDNAVDSRDLYVVERPLTTTVLVGIDTVLYNGRELRPATEETLDRLGHGPQWELRTKPPRYWSVDHTDNPTVLRIHPAPVLTGSALPVLPPVPLPLDWKDNLVVYYREVPQSEQEEAALVQVLPVWEDVVAYETAAALAHDEGEGLDEVTSTVFRELSALWKQRLGLGG